jgi:nucleotide-binding universal stress UspA family protein
MKIKRASKPGTVSVELGRKDPQMLAQASPFKLKQILVPIDFSACSKQALRYAVPMAEQFDAQLILLHVMETVTVPTEFGYAPPDAGSAGMTGAQEALVELGQRVKSELGTRCAVQVVVQRGIPWQAITTAAQTADVDLIILSTHGYTGLQHVFLGSTAERVVRHAPCPVLVVRERQPELLPQHLKRKARQ